MLIHQLLIFKARIYFIFTFYNRRFIVNFVKSTYNSEFTNNTIFGVKNNLISSLLLTQFKIIIVHAMFQFDIKNTGDSFLYKYHFDQKDPGIITR